MPLSVRLATPHVQYSSQPLCCCCCFTLPCVSTAYTCRADSRLSCMYPIHDTRATQHHAHTECLTVFHQPTHFVRQHATGGVSWSQTYQRLRGISFCVLSCLPLLIDRGIGDAEAVKATRASEIMAQYFMVEDFRRG